MNYPVMNSIQLRAVLRALRRSRAFSQAQAGQLLGVNQKRLAAIEKSPGVTGFDQIARLVAALGGRLVIDAADAQPAAPAGAAQKRASRKAGAPATARRDGTW